MSKRSILQRKMHRWISFSVISVHMCVTDHIKEEPVLDLVLNLPGDSIRIRLAWTTQKKESE